LGGTGVDRRIVLNCITKENVKLWTVFHCLKSSLIMCSCKNGYEFDVILTVHRRKYVEIKCQLDATDVFIADLIVCSTCFGHHYAHHQELKSIIQWLLHVVFRAVVCRMLVYQ